MEFDWIVKQKFGKDLGEKILVLANEWRHPFDKVMKGIKLMRRFNGMVLRSLRSSEYQRIMYGVLVIRDHQLVPRWVIIGVPQNK